MSKILGMSAGIGRGNHFPCCKVFYPNKSLSFTTQKRYLYHSGLDIAVEYDYLPTRTTNFAFDVTGRRDVTIEKTLDSSLVTQWGVKKEDTIIKEIWDAGGIKSNWEWFHKIYELWITPLTTTSHMLWLPLDRTHKIYSVEITSLLVGGEEFELQYYGKQSPRWISTSVELHLKLRRANPPSCNIYTMGGSTT